jgi:predicted Rossmann-fold nucleotide-binding protein
VTLRLVVCGGRDYADVWAVHKTLTRLHAERGIAAIIQGGAKGADELARIWASEHDIPVETFDADWKQHGKAAGPIRNGVMLAESKPDGVVAFPGGRGTADCVRQAEAAGLTVWRRHR